MNKDLNLIFLGGFDYPFGMAGTKRIQNIINGLKVFPEIEMRVLVVRQSSKKNVLNGVYQGIPYETVMGDLIRSKLLLMAPLLLFKSRKAIQNLYDPEKTNVLYVYGPPQFENTSTIIFAKKIGFSVIFDIVEDYDFAHDIRSGFFHRIKIAYICRMIKKLNKISDGLVLISTHLEKKFNNIISNKLQMHKLLISVDVDKFAFPVVMHKKDIFLFYAGSFGLKDGIPVLLDAFDKLAFRRLNIKLVMTGRGDQDSMRLLSSRIDISPYKDRIDFKGYLSESEYLNELCKSDILCMPRIDLGYAQAGFPFKLGEYLATGKPVIASAVSDVSLFLSDRKNVMLVSPGDSSAIVTAVDYLIDNPEHALEIGANGRAISNELFDYRAQGVALRDFLRQVSRPDVRC